MQTSSLSINDQFVTTSDGTRIAYHVEGRGPALVLTNGLLTTTSFWKYVRPTWLRHYTVVTWDMPGHGNSSPARTAETASILAQPACIAAVMRAAGISRAVQIGWSTGSQVVLETYRQYPQLCEGLVMLLGGAGHALSNTRLPIRGSAIDWLARRLPERVFAALYRSLMITAPTSQALRVARLTGMIGKRTDVHDARELARHFGCVDPYTAQRLLISAQAHSAHAVLRSLSVPLLIVAGDDDPFAPSASVGVELKRAATNAELVRVPRGSHTALLEDPGLISDAVLKFLRAQTLAYADDRSD